MTSPPKLGSAELFPSAAEMRAFSGSYPRDCRAADPHAVGFRSRKTGVSVRASLGVVQAVAGSNPVAHPSGSPGKSCKSTDRHRYPSETSGPNWGPIYFPTLVADGIAAASDRSTHRVPVRAPWICWTGKLADEVRRSERKRGVKP